VSEEAILETLAQEQKKARSQTQEDPQIKKIGKIPRQELLEMHLLSLIIQSNSPLENLQFALKKITIQDIAARPIKRIVEILSDKPIEDKFQVDSYLPQELKDTCNRLYLLDLGNVVTDKKLFEKELAITLTELRKAMLRRKLSLLTTNDMEEESEVIEIKKITEELKDIGGKRS
jgi:hypothetical protein